jgi:ferredoxin
VQCGLCEKACPEDAITLKPRFLFDAELRQQPRMLNEEQPFCCISCGKPFGTRSMLDNMLKKLEGHWMFQDEDSRRRLQMCDHCRVKDMFKTGRQGGPPGV